MNKPSVFMRTVERGELASIVDGLRERGLQFVYYESAEKVDLLAYRTPQENWTIGRAFGQALEVQWSWNGKQFDLLLLTEAETAAPEGWSEWQPVCGDDGGAFSSQPMTIRLYGIERRQLASYHYRRADDTTAPEWVETRLPRSLVYPVAGRPKLVRVRAIVYTFGQVPLLTRWQRLEGSNE